MATKKKQTAVDRETTRLLDWFERRATVNGGLMPQFSNADAVEALYQGSLKDFGRAHGNVQSRVDFACYACDLPPLGLTADAPFSKAWATEGRTWAFPVPKMQGAAQSRTWTAQDFKRIAAAAVDLPGAATKAWHAAILRNEPSVKAWAFSFQSTTAAPRIPLPKPPVVRIDWTRDELILALALYMQDREHAWDDKDVPVIELSALLNRLGVILGVKGGETFRNANGVAMKLMNFRSVDPFHQDAGKAGLRNRSKLEAEVWAEYWDKPQKLHEVATAIRATVANYKGKINLTGDDEPDIETAPEGKLFTKMHRYRERSRKLVEACKKAAFKKHKRLFCSACNFDFRDKYGEESANIIDCHHQRPVHTLKEDDKTHVKDLILLCANCHRVVHSRSPWLSIDELKARLTASNRGSLRVLTGPRQSES